MFKKADLAAVFAGVGERGGYVLRGTVVNPTTA
jgi:hypothetical protein